LTIKIKRMNVISSFYRCWAVVPSWRNAIISPSQSPQRWNAICSNYSIFNVL